MVRLRFETNLDSTLRLPQYQIHDPAPADVRAVAAAVGQDVFVLASRVLEGVGQDRQSVEGTLLVDALGEQSDGGCEPGRVERDRTERIAEDVAERTNDRPVPIVTGLARRDEPQYSGHNLPLFDLIPGCRAELGHDADAPGDC